MPSTLLTGIMVAKTSPMTELSRGGERNYRNNSRNDHAWQDISERQIFPDRSFLAIRLCPLLCFGIGFLNVMDTMWTTQLPFPLTFLMPYRMSCYVVQFH